MPQSHKLKICSWLLGLPLILAAANVYAYDDGEVEDNGTISLYGSACEKVRSNEGRSSVRVRAIDKATFLAVEKIAELQELHNQIDEHDFNVMVYNLVDNYIEDMTIKTIKQDKQQICVEVTGYLQNKNISNAMVDALGKQDTQEEPVIERYPDKLEIEADKLAPPSPNPLFPPKPKLAKTRDLPQLADTLDEFEKKTLIKVKPVKFFNGSVSEAYSKILLNLLKQQENFASTADEKNAAYTLQGNVLKAKVDAINDTTSRLQMVVAVEAKDLESGESIIERQNRFVIYSQQKDEQKVAFDLMKKLLEQASRQTLQNIEQIERKKGNYPNLPKIITPTNSIYKEAPHSPDLE